MSRGKALRACLTAYTLELVLASGARGDEADCVSGVISVEVAGALKAGVPVQESPAGAATHRRVRMRLVALPLRDDVSKVN